MKVRRERRLCPAQYPSGIVDQELVDVVTGQTGAFQRGGEPNRDVRVTASAKNPQVSPAAGVVREQDLRYEPCLDEVHHEADAQARVVLRVSPDGVELHVGAASS